MSHPSHQGQLRKEKNLRDRVKTGSDGSDDPEGAGIKACGPKMNKAEAQLNRFRSSGDTSSSDRSTSREESGDKGKIHEAVVSGS